MKSVSAFCLLLLLFIAGAVPAGAAPTLVYSTWLGGEGVDIAVDSAGNAVVLRQGGSPDYGYSLAKLSPSGELIFLRGLELPDRDPLAIAIDPAGYIYIAGTRSLEPSWGVEGHEAFVAKLAPDGTGVIYENSIWERGGVEGLDVAVDALGQAYLHFHALTDYIVSVVSFSPAGSVSRWFGGRPHYVDAMALGPSGDLFTVGWTYAEEPDEGYLEFHLGRMDASSGAVIETLLAARQGDFPLQDVAATPSDGSVVVWKKSEGLSVTEFGPAGEEIFSRVLDLGAVDISDVAVTSSGEIVLAGYTRSSSLLDAFVVRLEGGTGQILSSISLGGSGNDYAHSVAVGPGGDAYVVGFTRSPDFPTVNPLQPYNGRGDGFIARISENRPPDCSRSTASPSTIWPPDRRQVRISTLGVTDPDGDPVALKVTRILQDELFTARMPDAGYLGTAKPWVRADRMDNGDGRVYHLFFEATDPAGAKCTGVVKVCVPIQSGGACRDGGARFDSTLPR